MLIDRQIKILLSVIAFALSVIAINPWIEPKSVQAQGGYVIDYKRAFMLEINRTLKDMDKNLNNTLINIDENLGRIVDSTGYLIDSTTPAIGDINSTLQNIDDNINRTLKNMDKNLGRIVDSIRINRG